MNESPASENEIPQGLTEAEAAARLAADGPNELPRIDKRSLLGIAADVFREPMFQLLLIAGAIYLVIGDVGDALMLLGFATVNVIIAIYQESKTERVLEALRDLTSPRALVIRDGTPRRIPGREVVRGDILVLAEGDRVSADALLLSCDDLQADESLLTGEAVPVRKRARNGGLGGIRPGGDDQPVVYAGALVVRGHGIAEVHAAGAAAEVGRIGAALREVEKAPTPLHVQTRQVVRITAIIGLTLSVLVFALYVVLRGGWLDALLGAITLAMATLPQEFPLVLTVFLVMGAGRISQRRVLTRRSAAIEALGAATVLCTDKTGTLTMNQMIVAELRVGDLVFDASTESVNGLPDAFHTLVEFAILASERDPFDPMEKAFHALGERYLARTEHLHRDWTLMRDYGLRPELLAMAHVWSGDERNEHVVAAKGAPEAVADLCHLDTAGLGALRNAVAIMAQRGLRVLAVAHASFRGELWPARQHDFDFELLGLVGLADPLRLGVAEAIAACHDAGIRVVMVTGDHPVTASAVAAAAGLPMTGGVIDGAELASMTEEALRACIRHTSVFARIMPEQKLSLVEALKANGEIVAMTGDGVNDAPALKSAHIGIAMGGRGTDVAREAASLVLLDDDFASIVAAVRLGRRIFGNLQKAMAYIVAIHVPIAGLSVLPLVFGWPLVFSPVHIVFLELVIDPVCAIVFEAEAEERDAMRRPPRDPHAPLFTARLVAWSVTQGLFVLAIVVGVLVVSLDREMPADEARAMAFVTLVIANVALIVVNRSSSAAWSGLAARANPALWLVIGVAIGVLALILAMPDLRAMFRFGRLHGADISACAVAGFVTLVGLVVLRRIVFAARPRHREQARF